MKDKIVIILNTIQTITLICILVILLNNRKYDNRMHPSSPRPETFVKLDKPLKIKNTDTIWGSKDAPNTIIAYVDYQCPFCMDFYKNINALEKDYITTGKLKVIFRNFPLRIHANARKLAIAVECAQKQGKSWELIDRIFTSKVKPDEIQIAKWIDELKLDQVAFKACVTDSVTDTEISNNIEEARSFGARGTPSVFINDVLVRGTLPSRDIIKILEGKKQIKQMYSGSCN
jgi:protein-disulfide isomerase